MEGTSKLLRKVQLDWGGESRVRATQTICAIASGYYSLRCSGRGWGLRLRLQRSLPGRGLGLAVWRQPEGSKEWYAMGWGVEGHSWENLGGGLGPQEKQGTTVGEGKGRRWATIGISSHADIHTLRGRGASGTGYWWWCATSLGHRRQYIWCGLWVAGHLFWRLSAGEGVLSTTWHLLNDLKAVGANHSSHLRRQSREQLATGRGLWTGTTCSNSHLGGQPRKGHCNQIPPIIALTPPGNTPWCCHCQMLQAARHTYLITVTYQSPATRSRLLHISTDPCYVKDPATRHWLLTLAIASISLEAYVAP